MFLFELAMELGVRSADMADAAPELGLEGNITPTSELTPEQAAVLRAKFSKTPVGAPSSATPQDAPSSWGPPGAGPDGGPGGGSGGGRSIGPAVGVAVVVLAVVGLFAFMFMNSGPDKEREAQLAREKAAHDAADAKAYEAGGTAAPDDGEDAAASEPAASSDVPKELDRFCTAGESAHQFSEDVSDAIGSQDMAEVKRIVGAGLEQWKADVLEIQATVPTSAIGPSIMFAGYTDFFAAFLTSSTIEEVKGKVAYLPMDEIQTAWEGVQTSIYENCI